MQDPRYLLHYCNAQGFQIIFGSDRAFHFVRPQTDSEGKVYANSDVDYFRKDCTVNSTLYFSFKSRKQFSVLFDKFGFNDLEFYCCIGSFVDTKGRNILFLFDPSYVNFSKHVPS